MTKYFDEKLMERFRLLYIFINMTWLITVLVFNQYSAFDSYTWYVFSGGLIPVYVSSSSSALSYLAEGRALEEFGRDFDKRSWEFAKAFDKGIQTLRGRRNVAKQTPRPEDSQVSLLPNEQKRITWICVSDLAVILTFLSRRVFETFLLTVNRGVVTQCIRMSKNFEAVLHMSCSWLWPNLQLK